MLEFKSAAVENESSRDRLAELLNEDLAREYQAIYRLRGLLTSARRC